VLEDRQKGSMLQRVKIFKTQNFRRHIGGVCFAMQKNSGTMSLSHSTSVTPYTTHTTLTSIFQFQFTLLQFFILPLFSKLSQHFHYASYFHTHSLIHPHHTSLFHTHANLIHLANRACLPVS
jgi:hypothetical protein